MRTLTILTLSIFFTASLLVGCGKDENRDLRCVDLTKPGTGATVSCFQ